MLTVGTLPILFKIVGKLDIKPIIPILQAENIFEDAENAAAAKKQLSKEKLGLLATKVIAEIMPQLTKIADDIPTFAAAYKGIPEEEAVKLDAAEFINDIINDEGIVRFFTNALRRKAEQELSTC